jgi:glycolate oxidase FAD binding subunit
MSRIANEDQVVDFVRAARAGKTPFEIVAGGTRRSVGKPVLDSKGGDLPMLDVSGLSGIVKYEPAELIITAQPATSLAEIKAVLAERNQRLGFDPADWSRLLGSNGVASLAGAASSDASGSGKLRHGGARDSLLGFRAVNGLGESFRGGAKVVKNVTGFDLPKLMCGAYGTLGVLTEMTFRVYPQPQFAATLCLSDITPEDGFAALRKIALSALEPAGLAYLPASMLAGRDMGQGAALIKLEGARQPLEEKIALAHGLLGNAIQRIEADPFTAIGCGEKFADITGEIWRVMIARADAPRLVKELNVRHWLGDWAGAVLWLAADPSEGPRIRAAAAKASGQAMLLRASAASRASLGLFAPQPPALAALNRSVKAAFDPLSLFNPGRL